jgi:hypothetical protein
MDQFGCGLWRMVGNVVVHQSTLVLKSLQLCFSYNLKKGPISKFSFLVFSQYNRYLYDDVANSKTFCEEIFEISFFVLMISQNFRF